VLRRARDEGADVSRQRELENR